MANDYKKGERVRHPSKADWGLGVVLEDSRGGNVRIFFVEVGEKKLSLQHVQPEKVAAKEAAHPVLDNLKTSGTRPGIKYQSFAESKKFFLDQYPEGFFDQKYLGDERNYKVTAHELAVKLLGNQVFTSKLDSEDYAALCKSCLQVLNATNLVFPNEKMALKDGLLESDAQREFVSSLHNCLYGSNGFQNGFEGFMKVLENIGADKWTIASYFPFIVQPDKYMFLKPTVTQHAADLCQFEISYRPQLNWTTYKMLLKFSEYLRSELADMKPRDFIDVQSFMWRISPYFR